jgi:hypothetical protein
MKKLIVLSVILGVTLLAGNFFAPAHAQDSTKEEKPTFYRLVPGTYVNGWPRFTITYPKDWVEETPMFHEIFRASAPDQALGEKVTIAINPFSESLDKVAGLNVSGFKAIAKDVAVLSDKPSQLRDGIPAREVELQMVLNGLAFNYLFIGTKKGDTLIGVGVGSFRGRIREDLKAILYSLEFQPGKDEPVKVSPDIQEFLDKYCSAIVSHDVAKVMTHFSDRYLNSGVKKGEMERFWRQYIGPITSIEVGITDLVPMGDKVYLAGFSRLNFGRQVLKWTSIIKENGEWKWYGNQRDVSP